jgi:hypothetical protein
VEKTVNKKDNRLLKGSPRECRNGKVKYFIGDILELVYVLMGEQFNR